MSNIIDMGKYWLSTAEQGSQEWLSIRESLKITGSNFHSAYLYVKGRGPKPNTGHIEPNEAMAYGTKMEPVIRDWFAKTYNLEVREVGIAIPKDYPYIGSSVDGVIIKEGRPVGIIEIKTTKKHHDLLLTQNKLSPWHFAQVQGGMNVMDLPYCYYVSYSRETNNIHVTKVLIDRNYWNNDLLPALKLYTK